MLTFEVGLAGRKLGTLSEVVVKLLVHGRTEGAAHLASVVRTVGIPRSVR